MIRKIDHLVITTANPKDCLAFYQKLGFIVDNADGRYELFAGDFKINVHIKGNELLPHAQHIQTGSSDLCFEITDKLEDFYQKLNDSGIIAETGIVKRNGVNGAMHSVYLRDPDGNLLEFCCYK